jgi:hypothetical protein
MSLPDKISQLIEDEMVHRMNSVMNEYVEIISKKHGIALELLLRDIPPKYSGSLCKGMRSSGQRCLFRSVKDGYCRYHTVQGERVRTRTIPYTSLTDRNELIDLDRILFNE